MKRVTQFIMIKRLPVRPSLCSLRTLEILVALINHYPLYHEFVKVILENLEVHIEGEEGIQVMDVVIVLVKHHRREY